MIFEKDGKFYEKIEVEREISEMEYLKRKVKELEEKICFPTIQPAPIVICPCQRDDTVPYTDSPIWYYDPTQATFTNRVTL